MNVVVDKWQAFILPVSPENGHSGERHFCWTQDFLGAIRSDLKLFLHNEHGSDAASGTV